MSLVLVTGGSRFLGATICKRLAQEGFNLLIHYNTFEEGALEVQRACRNLGAQAEIIQGDFTSSTSMHDFLQKLNSFPISHLVNNASHYMIGSALDTSQHSWEIVINVNFHAPCAIIQALAAKIQQARGSIINLGVANLNTMKANSYNTAYMISKGALLALTKSLAKEMAPHLVTVNMISPGFMENSIDRPQLHPIPMGQLISFSEVADLIAFFFRKENRHITGQNIEIAGGWGL